MALASDGLRRTPVSMRARISTSTRARIASCFAASSALQCTKVCYVTGYSYCLSGGETPNRNTIKHECCSFGVGGRGLKVEFLQRSSPLQPCSVQISIQTAPQVPGSRFRARPHQLPRTLQVPGSNSPVSQVLVPVPPIARNREGPITRQDYVFDSLASSSLAVA